MQCILIPRATHWGGEEKHKPAYAFLGSHNHLEDDVEQVLVQIICKVEILR